MKPKCSGTSRHLYTLWWYPRELLSPVMTESRLYHPLENSWQTDEGAIPCIVISGLYHVKVKNTYFIAKGTVMAIQLSYHPILSQQMESLVFETEVIFLRFEFVIRWLDGQFSIMWFRSCWVKGISRCLLLTLKLPCLEYIAGLAFFTRLYAMLVGLNDTEFYFRSFSFFFKPFITLHNDFFFMF